MNKKIFAIITVLVMSLSILSLHVFAMTETTVQVHFEVQNGNSTVVIEAINDAPLPDVTEISDKTQGVFEMSYVEPDDYHYKVYQKQGTEENIIYDETVYNVIVSVLVNDDDSLYSIVTIGVDGENIKPTQLIFGNELVDANPPPEEIPGPITSIDNSMNLWFAIGCLIFAIILVIILCITRKKADK